MESAEIAFHIYSVYFAFSHEHVDKGHLKISRVFPFYYESKATLAAL